MYAPMFKFVFKRFASSPFVWLVITIAILVFIVVDTAIGVSTALTLLSSGLEALSNVVIVEFKDSGVITLDVLLKNSSHLNLVDADIVSRLRDQLSKLGFSIREVHCVLKFRANIAAWGPVGRYLACETYRTLKSERIRLRGNASSEVLSVITDVFEKACAGLVSVYTAPAIGVDMLIVDKEVVEEGLDLGGYPLAVIRGEPPRTASDILLPIAYYFRARVEPGAVVPLVFILRGEQRVVVEARVSGFIPVYNDATIVTTFDAFKRMFNVTSSLCNMIVLILSRRLSANESVRLAESIKSFLANYTGSEVFLRHPYLAAKRAYEGNVLARSLLFTLSSISPAIAVLVATVLSYFVYGAVRDMVELAARYGWRLWPVYTPLAVAALLAVICALTASYVVSNVLWEPLYAGLARLVGVKTMVVQPLSGFAREAMESSMILYTVVSMVTSPVVTLVLLLKRMPLASR